MSKVARFAIVMTIVGALLVWALVLHVKWQAWQLTAETEMVLRNVKHS